MPIFDFNFDPNDVSASDAVNTATQQPAKKDTGFGGMSMSDIINAALAIYGIKQGQKPPKFYIAPQTPNEQWKSDATKGLFDYASGYTNQYLQGLGNLNPNYKLPTSMAGNPAFMGGVKVPTFDSSNMPARPGVPTGSPTPGQSPTPGVPNNPSPTGTGVDKPAGSPGDPFAGMPTGGAGGLTPGQQAGMGQIGDWLRQHPNIAKGGADVAAAAIGIAGGPLAAIIAAIGGKAFKAWFDNWIKQPQGEKVPTLPQSGVPINPRDLTPGGTPTRVKIDPSTGLWSMDNPSPTETAWLNSINSFNSSLSSGSPSGGGTPDPQKDFGGWYDWYYGGGQGSPWGGKYKP